MKRWVMMAALLLASAQAAAYVIPGRSVLKRFATKQALDKVDPKPLDSRVVVLEGREEKRGSGQVVLEGDRACVLSVELPEGVAKVRYSKGQLTSEGPRLPALEAMAALGCPFVALKQMPAESAEALLVKQAEQLGISTKKVSMGLNGTRPSWVVGAGPRDLSTPQIWFDKETSRPVRVIAQHGGRTWEVRYADSRSVATARRHPRVAEVWLGDTRVLAMRLMTAADERVGADASESEDESE